MKLELRTLRTELMHLLYQYDLYKSDQLPFIPVFENESTSDIYYQIIDHLSKIDELIESNLYDYKLYRLSFVDRAIIRLATFELLKTDLDKRIIIDEAIELTKTYSNLDDMKQHKFNNRVLDEIAKKLRG